MAGAGTPSAPTAVTPTPARSKQRLIEHPGRVAIVIVTLAVVISLGALLLNHSDTDTRTERIYPTAVETVSPRPGELIRLQDTITADLRDGLTGVLLIDRQEVPLDQLEIVKPLSQISFRPGPGKDLERFEPGVHTATVLYWVGTQFNRPAKVGSYSWQFRAGA
jgi:hypothetical protein